MQNKKTKNTKKEESQESHIFEIHTMQSDNEKNKNSQKQPITDNAKKIATATVGVNALNSQNENIKSASKPQKLPTVQEDNPFLTKETPGVTSSVSKGSFSPGQQQEPVEKINQTPGDIVFDDGEKDEILKPSKSPKSSKKTISIIIIILIIIFLVGVVGFGFFMLKSKDGQENNNISIAEDVPVNVINDTNDDVKDVVEENMDEQIKQTYSIDLPNYFSIDVESITSQEDIVMELETISKNMTTENIEGPISFIVTDANNNPVSFNVFAVSSNMIIPQNILSALEEEFELYAYNDGVSGVRFGFAIDTKNSDTLKTELLASENDLPKAFDLILNGLGVNATNVVFNDSVYETHPVRYFNLNEGETYSVDYTINDMRFIVGASKSTLREVVDYLKSAKLPQTSEDNLEY